MEKTPLTVFMGGTCNGSQWRETLMAMFPPPWDKSVDFFNPVVEDWNEEAQANEIWHRENCDVCLYVLTPKMTGTYSIAEVVDDSNKRPEKVVFVIMGQDDGWYWTPPQVKSLEQVKQLVKNNKGAVIETLHQVSEYLMFRSSVREV